MHLLLLCYARRGTRSRLAAWCPLFATEFSEEWNASCSCVVGNDADTCIITRLDCSS
jgi:hypothetical protein